MSLLYTLLGNAFVFILFLVLRVSTYGVLKPYHSIAHKFELHFDLQLKYELIFSKSLAKKRKTLFLLVALRLAA